MPFYSANKLKSKIGFLLIVLAATQLIAEPLPPLVDCVGDECLQANTPGYDLSAFDIPFSYSWPTAPNTTQTIDVTPGSISSLRNAIATTGARVVVPAGTYSGNLTIWGSDVDVVMDNAAFLQGYVGIRQQSRVRWRGGNISDQNSGYAVLLFDATDVTFDNVNIESNQSGSAGNEGISFRPAGVGTNRFAFINSTLEFTDGNGWGLLGPCNDCILANVDITNNSTGATFRTTGNRQIVVDSVMDARGNTAMRTSGTTDLYWANIINIGRIHTDYSSAGGPAFDINNGVARNISKYDSSGNSFIFQPLTIGSGTAANNTLHSTNTSLSGSPGMGPFTGSNNRTVSWDGQTINYSAMPGKSSRSDYGADH
jgi:hypothetical protein